MISKLWINTALASLSFVALQSFAHDYAPGIHRWKVSGGTFIVVSGLLTNGLALYAHNYNFYFEKDGDQRLYQVPLLDKKKPGNYELSLTTKAKDERMVRDARIEIRNNEIYLLRAQSIRENDFDDSPITVSRYRFVMTEGDDWPYLFQLVSSKTNPIKKNEGVDSALSQEAKQIK